MSSFATKLFISMLLFMILACAAQLEDHPDNPLEGAHDVIHEPHAEEAHHHAQDVAVGSAHDGVEDGGLEHEHEDHAHDDAHHGHDAEHDHAHDDAHHGHNCSHDHAHDDAHHGHNCSHDHTHDDARPDGQEEARDGAQGTPGRSIIQLASTPSIININTSFTQHNIFEVPELNTDTLLNIVFTCDGTETDVVVPILRYTSSNAVSKSAVCQIPTYSYVSCDGLIPTAVCSAVSASQKFQQLQNVGPGVISLQFTNTTASPSPLPVIEDDGSDGSDSNLLYLLFLLLIIPVCLGALLLLWLMSRSQTSPGEGQAPAPYYYPAVFSQYPNDIEADVGAAGWPTPSPQLSAAEPIPFGAASGYLTPHNSTPGGYFDASSSFPSTSLYPMTMQPNQI